MFFVCVRARLARTRGEAAGRAGRVDSIWVPFFDGRCCVAIARSSEMYASNKTSCCTMRGGVVVPRSYKMLRFFAVFMYGRATHSESASAMSTVPSLIS